MEGGRSVMEGGSVMEGERNRAEGGRNVVERKKECHGWRERNMMEKKRYDGGKERSRKKEKGMREGTRKKAPGGRTRREGQERGPRGVQEEEWRENKVSEGGKEGEGRGRRGVVEWRAWWRGRQRQGKPLGVHGTPKPPPLPLPPIPAANKEEISEGSSSNCTFFAASLHRFCCITHRSAAGCTRATPLPQFPSIFNAFCRIRISGSSIPVLRDRPAMEPGVH